MGAAALAVAVGILAVGCGPDKKDTGTIPGHNPPLFPTSSPRPPSPTPGAAQGECGGKTPQKVPAIRGWDAIYTMCGNLTGTSAVITNTSTGVLHVVPDQGAPVLGRCARNLTDPVMSVESSLLPTGSLASVWIPPGGCATIASLGPAYVRVNLDYTMSGAIFLASSLTKYAMDKVGANRALNFLNNIGECANSATVLWRTTSSTPPPVSTVLSSALGGYSACKGVMDAVNEAVGAGTEVKAESTGWLTAAREVGSGAWEDLLKLAIKDPHLLSVLPK